MTLPHFKQNVRSYRRPYQILAEALPDPTGSPIRSHQRFYQILPEALPDQCNLTGFVSLAKTCAKLAAGRLKFVQQVVFIFFDFHEYSHVAS